MTLQPQYYNPTRPPIQNIHQTTNIIHHLASAPAPSLTTAGRATTQMDSMGEDAIIDIEGDICPVCEFECTCGAVKVSSTTNTKPAPPPSAPAPTYQKQGPLSSVPLAQPGGAPHIHNTGGTFGVFALNPPAGHGPTAGVFPASANAPKKTKKKTNPPAATVKKEEETKSGLKIRVKPLSTTSAPNVKTESHPPSQSPTTTVTANGGPRKRGRPSKAELAARQKAEEAALAAARSAAQQALQEEESTSTLTDLEEDDAGTPRARRGSDDFPTFVSAFTSSNASDSASGVSDSDSSEEGEEGESDDSFDLDLGDDSELEEEEERAIVWEHEGRWKGDGGREGKRRKWAWQKGMRRERERRAEDGEDVGSDEAALTGPDDDEEEEEDEEEQDGDGDTDAVPGAEEGTASPHRPESVSPALQPVQDQEPDWTESSDEEEDRFFAHLSDFSDFSSDFYDGLGSTSAPRLAATDDEETESDEDEEDARSGSFGLALVKGEGWDYAADSGPFLRTKKSHQQQRGKSHSPASSKGKSRALSAPATGKRSADEKRTKSHKRRRRERRPKMVLVEDGDGRLVFGGEWEHSSLGSASASASDGEMEMMELFPSEDEAPTGSGDAAGPAGAEGEGPTTPPDPEPERLAFVPLSQPDELLGPLTPLPPPGSALSEADGDIEEDDSEESSEWTGEGETTDEEDVPGLRREEAEAMLELGLVRSRSRERDAELAAAQGNALGMEGLVDTILLPPTGMDLPLPPPAPTLASVIASAAAAVPPTPAPTPAPAVQSTPSKPARPAKPLARTTSSNKAMRPHPLPRLSTWTTPVKSMIFVVDGKDSEGISPFAKIRRGTGLDCWAGGQKRRRESSSRSEASWYYSTSSKRQRTAYSEHEDNQEPFGSAASSLGEPDPAPLRQSTPDALDLDDLLDTSYFLYDESIPSSEAEGEDDMEDSGDNAIMRHLTRLDSVPLGQWFRRARAQGVEAGMEMSLSVAAFAVDHEGDDTLLAPDLVGRSMVVVSPIIFPARDAYVPERSPSPVMLDGEGAGPLSSISLRAALSPKKKADRQVKSHKERRREKKRVLNKHKGGAIDVTPRIRKKTPGRAF